MLTIAAIHAVVVKLPVLPSRQRTCGRKHSAADDVPDFAGEDTQKTGGSSSSRKPDFGKAYSHESIYKRTGAVPILSQTKNGYDAPAWQNRVWSLDNLRVFDLVNVPVYITDWNLEHNRRWEFYPPIAVVNALLPTAYLRLCIYA